MRSLCAVLLCLWSAGASRAAPAAPADCNQLEDVPAARCILHSSDWGSLASVSSRAEIAGYPFASVKSIADGPARNASGVPYLYLTPLDLAVSDLVKADNRTTLVVSLAQGDYCARHNYDPMHPFCSRLMISGKLTEVERRSAEYEFAWGALLERHPEFAHYPADHGWFVAKVQPENIFMLNHHGPVKRIPVDQYLQHEYRPL